MNPEYRTQGKCQKCKVRHTWPERLGKFYATGQAPDCPVCGTPLQRTTYRSSLPARDWPLGLGKFPEQWEPRA